MLGCISPGVDFVLGDHSTSPLSNRIQAFHSSSHGVVLLLSSVHFFRVQSAVLHLLRAQRRARALSLGAIGLGLRGEGAVRSAPAKNWRFKWTSMPSAPGEKNPQDAPGPATAPPLVQALRPVDGTGSPTIDLRLAQQSWPGNVVLLRPCVPWPPQVPVQLLLNPANPQKNAVHSLSHR